MAASKNYICNVFVYADYFYSLPFSFYLRGEGSRVFKFDKLPLQLSSSLLLIQNLPMAPGIEWNWGPSLASWPLSYASSHYRYRNLLMKMFNGALLTATSSVTDRFLWCQYKYKLVWEIEAHQYDRELFSMVGIASGAILSGISKCLKSLA